MQVLSVIDSNNHSLTDMRGSNVPSHREQNNEIQQQEKSVKCKEKLSISIKSIGISFINTLAQVRHNLSFSIMHHDSWFHVLIIVYRLLHLQELLFVSAGNVSLDLIQSIDQQSLSFQISSLQIDNQLHSTPYPVVLSFDQEYKNYIGGKLVSIGESGDSDVCQPVFYLNLAKWKNSDSGLVSVQRVNLRFVHYF